MAKISEELKQITDLMLPRMNKVILDHVEHPWLYDFRAALLLKQNINSLPHDDSCPKCKDARDMMRGNKQRDTPTPPSPSDSLNQQQ